MESKNFVKFFSSKKGFIIYLSVILFLAFLSLGKSLSFHFYRDDWTQFWYAINYPQLFLSKSTVFIMHPGAAIEEFIGLKVFGMNPFLWQLWGLILRLLNSLALALIMYVMTRSKTIAYLAGILYAPSAIGIESIVGVSSHTSPMIIVFFAPGFYFWVNSSSKFLSIKRIGAFIFLFLSVWISPLRTLPLLLIIPLWEISHVWVGNSKEKLSKKSVLLKIRNLLVLTPIFLYIRNYMVMFGSPPIKTSWTDIKALLTSLGSLSLGWLIPFPESVSQSESSRILIAGGIVFLAILIFISILFTFFRIKKLRVYFLLFALMFITYFPNWLTSKYMMVGVSHRYLTLSGLGLVGVLAIFISGLRYKAQRILVLVFVAASIFNSNRILIRQNEYRSFTRTQAIINRLDKDVPLGQKDFIFLFLGGQLRAEVFDMGGVPMFAFKRGITEEKDLPIATGDIELIKNLLCKEGVKRPALNYWIIQENKVPLSHVYAWHLDDKGMLINTSGSVREDVKRQLNCDYLK
ncbi:MAG: hypothetical protein UT40_C0006G0015 [Candidatus Woesebacteria bacterium GW2011_GWA1_39_21b]|uniref:Glycosyltransferase RgtA/B/C/D-like domain-containing protein n=2 Tax=Candidatus Woeseibacteriota TaxID=1752722 RepID=A0A0G0QUK6_9BACT|nr:MAG: hypothetical protein US72_C0015G0020 [Microgenomates group bacterium GW2011_GWC1_38_12]KKR14025.1 MAG: hypothetical protein UT40_C0006G0015 [Candidatus Woesebacteria bacterium GW2011_GWA1_39_21b]OGM65671.1 MAG: hypothetical protein A3A52_02165 [Candidatus Woesebacteria bacterium RIFCSPLOWO2_01_FULL_39_14]